MIKRNIIYIFVRLLVRKKFFNMYKTLYKISLRGMGIFNFQDSKISGEKKFTNSIILKYKSEKINIFDVGANIGDYTNNFNELDNTYKVYSFEPQPNTFEKLEKRFTNNKNITTINFGLGDKEEKIILYDYSSVDGSPHASTNEKVFSEINKKKSKKYEILINTVDYFIKINNIKKLHLLKVDVEGHEFKVLEGAKESISKGIIENIHFEFTKINIYNHLFFKDYYNILKKKYNIYRMLPDGLVRIDNFEDPYLQEIFGYQNLVAIKK